jgi:hypothetical protein
MSGIAYDPSKKIQFRVVAQSPHTCGWKLWMASPGATSWTVITKGKRDAPQQEFGPFAQGTELLYKLLVGGNANTDWRMEVRILQDGNPLACAPQIETGFMTNTIAGREVAFPLR